MAGYDGQGLMTKKEHKSSYYEVTDGEWIAIPWKGYKEMCCSCGLVHRIDYRVVDGQLHAKSTADHRATNGARRHSKFTKDEG